MQNLPYLIVGQGLAGSILGWEFLKAGVPLKIFQEKNGQSASATAAGLITPITGKRWKKSQGIEDFLPKAIAFYQSLEKDFNQSFWENRTTIRIFSSAEDEKTFRERSQDAAYIPYFGEEAPAGTWANDPLGSVSITGGGVLNTTALLAAFRTHFEKAHLYIEESFDFNKLDAKAKTYNGEPFQGVIFCEGAAVIKNPFFKDLPFRPAKGEILTLQAPMPDSWLPHVFNSGHWLLPLSPYICRVGATYAWEYSPEPTPKARAELLASFKRLAPHVFMPVLLEQKTGIRLAMEDTLPIVGPHPHLPFLHIFNGFGSKGSLYIPASAAAFVQNCLGNAHPLIEPFSIQRFCSVF